VCLDETSKQMIVETRAPIPAKPGQKGASRIRTNGVANMFMVFAPLEGWRHVKVTDRRFRLRARARQCEDRTGRRFSSVSAMRSGVDNCVLMCSNRSGPLDQAFLRP
jgi:hypothetical protein